MNRPSLRRTFFLLLLALTLVTPWAAAADLRPATSTHQTGAALASFNLFDSIWTFFTGLWNKEGCILDPNGLHASGEAGCIIDPNGRCAAATPAPGEAGCILDPDGRCGG